MFLNIILLFITLLILTGIFHYSHLTKESFLDFPDKHKVFIDESTKKLNSLTNQLNVVDSVIPVNSNTQYSAKTAFGNLIQKNNALVPNVQYEIPANTPESLQKAKSCQLKGPTCDAFDDTTFAANCGVSFDINGVGSDGKPHIGGMFLSFDDRAKQVIDAQNVRDNASAPYDPYKVYKPTLGTSKPGTFGINKDSCKIVKEKVDCLSKKTFNSPNCTQCYTSQDFARVGSDTDRIPSSLILMGNGTIVVTSTGAIKLEQIALTDTPITIPIPAKSEGTTFYIRIMPGSTLPTYISGYLQGETPRGTFKLDIRNLIQSDTITNSKPRLNGTKYVNGFRCFSIVPGSGQTSINLSCLMPFSFLSMYDGDALTCDNGPIITKAESATFLESDPCYGKANKPGNYKLECLQSRWMELGGTLEGTGYPSNQAKADAIQKGPNGAGLDIETIVDNLSEIMIKALTGKTRSGQILSIPDWNTASMFATGIPINTPCDGPGGLPPLSQQCLSYLHSNAGLSSRIGATYTLPAGQYAHSKGEGFQTQYNYKQTIIDPNTSVGLDFSKDLGGISGVKQSYDQINRVANDNSKTNTERSDAVFKAYNVNLGAATAKKKDFDISIPPNQPTQTYDDLKQVCESKGQRLCKSTEICDMSSRTVINPELTSTFPYDNWIAVSDAPNEWLSLNSGPDRYCKTHTEVANYLPDWGSKREPTGWGRLVKCCSGESGGMQGRYIKLQYSRVDWLNLKQIAVYTNENESSNIITPNTVVTLSSTNPDWFPASKFVNGRGSDWYNFAHSSNYEVPWILVDLGATVSIYKIVVTNRDDCCAERVLGTSLIILNTAKKPVYQSDSIKTINQTYTWFPPFKGNYVDYVGDKPTPPYKHVGCWGDTGDRAMPIIEGSDPRISGNYWGREDAINKCYSVSKERGYKVFAVQHNGHCQGTTDTNGYKRFGRSGGCYGAGKGGGWANDVYIIGDDTGKPNEGTWTCLPGIPVPVNKNENGDVQCMSYNNRDCLWRSNDAECNALLDSNPQNLAPLECGTMHAQKHGGPGYDNPAHWCAIANQRL